MAINTLLPKNTNMSSAVKQSTVNKPTMIPSSAKDLFKPKVDTSKPYRQTAQPKFPGITSATSTLPTTISAPKTPSVQSSPVQNPSMQSYIDTVYSAPQTTAQTQPTVQQTQPVQETPKTNNALSTYLSQYSQSIADQNRLRIEKANIENKQQEEQVKARNAYNAKLDESGMLRGGAIDAANVMERRAGITDQEFALQKLAYANLLSAMSQNQEANKPIQVGDNLIDPRTGETIYTKPSQGFELGKDQVRYEKDPLTGEYKQVARGIDGTNTSGTQSNELLSPSEATALGVPYGTTRGQAFGITPQKALTEGESKAKQYGANAKLANDALNSSVYNLGNIELPFVPNMFKSGDRQLFEQNARQFVNAILRRESGATITDTEFINKQKELIPQAGDSQDVLAQKKIARDLAVKNTIEAGTPFGTTQNQNVQLQPDEEEYLKLKGYSPEQINQLKSSFNTVGNTIGSNIPQRNKNPGNIKRGGMADSLAVGVDKFGHLIFPDEATGFKAMQMDIQAKINGNSRFLPANPTLAQLGKVYAEDPNWTTSVAKILGVNKDTPTKNIPINSLIKAIARQEGYYA